MDLLIKFVLETTEFTVDALISHAETVTKKSLADGIERSKKNLLRQKQVAFSAYCHFFPVFQKPYPKDVSMRQLAKFRSLSEFDVSPYHLPKVRENFPEILAYLIDKDKLYNKDNEKKIIQLVFRAFADFIQIPEQGEGKGKQLFTILEYFSYKESPLLESEPPSGTTDPCRDAASSFPCQDENIAEGASLACREYCIWMSGEKVNQTERVTHLLEMASHGTSIREVRLKKIM